MNPEDYRFMEEQERRLQLMQSQQETGQISNLNYQMQLENQEKSMIKDQLDLTDEVERIEHLLKGDMLKTDVDGNRTWHPAEDQEMIILTDYGIHLILNTISFYINKNTLLSNYDLETINVKMEDFATALADVIFMEYEKVFKYPTLQDCQKELEKKMRNKKEMRMFSAKLLGYEIDEADMDMAILKEMEGKVEHEMSKIKEQLVKNKLKRFEMILREIQDAVHSTYLRALNGAERRTLREHVHISENKGGMMPQKQSGGILNWFKGR